ncbi:hypothetical protein H6F90_14990 [Trichocoleus sp. FACHB-591]|uniref:hypothetical protein n=1 Tax=Trichocoleus sp. FACHB-591 TaxID=2692872 RepID=UPI0016843DDE|nr:hypothetical protein [Trichocoleus sp. FACHB-591]MBD2096442.1 hypothetical protein [Trichocoleus sp. FACHB-591]
MSRPRIQILPHLAHAELVRRQEECQDPKTKNYWLTIQLLSQPHIPMTVEQVAEILGFSTDWVRKLAGRYNRLGPVRFIDSHQRRDKVYRNTWRSSEHTLETLFST